MKFLVVLNRYKLLDREEFFFKVLREFVNVNIVYFCNFCIIIENRGDVENLEVGKLFVLKKRR